MNNKSVKTFGILLLIVLFPLIINWIYLFFINNSSIANQDIKDPNTYLLKIHSSVSLTRSFLLNSSDETCREITDTEELSHISALLNGQSLPYLIKLNMFPGYGVNLFQIKTKYSDDKFDEYMRRFCNFQDFYKFNSNAEIYNMNNYQ